MGVKQVLFRATPYLLGSGIAMVAAAAFIMLLSITRLFLCGDMGFQGWLVKIVLIVGIFLMALTLVPCSEDTAPP